MPVTAYKPFSKSMMEPCPPDDPAAVMFRVDYDGPLREVRYYLEFKDLTVATQVAAALDCAFDAGRKKAFRDLRKLIGVDCS